MRLMTEKGIKVKSYILEIEDYDLIEINPKYNDRTTIDGLDSSNLISERILALYMLAKLIEDNYEEKKKKVNK